MDLKGITAKIVDIKFEKAKKVSLVSFEINQKGTISHRCYQIPLSVGKINIDEVKKKLEEELREELLFEDSVKELEAQKGKDFPLFEGMPEGVKEDAGKPK